MSRSPLVTPVRVGILADSHLNRLTAEFVARVAACFADCAIILHAGDLTEPALLAAFADRELHAVHGNMCSYACRQILPTKTVVTLGSFRLGLIHRAGNSYDFEDQLIDQFEAVDCIVYGHTHRPVCHEAGGILFINPGSFMATGRHGAPGTYAILEVGASLRATIHEVPRTTP